VIAHDCAQESVELEKMRAAGLLGLRSTPNLRGWCQAGATTYDLEVVAEKMIGGRGGEAGF